MAKKHPCEGCRYFYGFYANTRCCNYIFVTGKKRPCPPGEECTVRKKQEEKTKKAMKIKGKVWILWLKCSKI